ncbi:MAG: EamA family transporter [Weeksellaceae bacterium]|nr:EamA family transporter [Weeksellaceae bacterium]
MWSNVNLRLHFIVLLWGFSGVLGKLISIEAVPLVFWRTLIAVIAIYVMVRAAGISLQVSRRLLLQFLGVGVIIAVHWYLFFGAIKVSNVSVALSTMATGAFFSALLEPLFFKTKLKPYELLLALLVMACLWLIFQASPEYWLGILMGVGCSLLSALFSILNAKLQRVHAPRKIMFYEMLGAFLCTFVVMLASGNMHMLYPLPTMDWVWLLVLGTLITAFPMIESVNLLKHISPFSLLLAVNLEPVYGIILAYFIFGESEQMSPVFYAAAMVMVLVIILNAIIKHREKKRATL